VTAPGQMCSKVNTRARSLARRNNLMSCDHPSESRDLCHGARGIDTLTPLAVAVVGDVAAVYAQHLHNQVKPLANIVAERRRSRRW
jgi:hypothetical protein